MKAKILDTHGSYTSTFFYNFSTFKGNINFLPFLLILIFCFLLQKLVFNYFRKRDVNFILCVFYTRPPEKRQDNYIPVAFDYF
jgi:hypothetical protein